MKTTQRLKQQIYKQVFSSGLYKQVQSKLKTQVLNIVDKQTNNNKKSLNFQYQHPLLNKLRKYPLTSLCIDLIHQFLSSFKFKYTLSVFQKQINLQNNNHINRVQLANNFNIQINNPQSQAVLLSLVSQLVNGDIKVNNNKSNNAFTNNRNQNQPRVNNFIQNQNLKPSQNTTASNFNKNSVQPPQDNSNNTSFNNSKSNISYQNNTSQQQSSNSNINSSINQTSSVNQNSSKQSQQSSVIDSSPKPSQNSVSEVKEQSDIKQSKDKKGKKKKQVEKPPEGATDLMAELMDKFKAKDPKADKQKQKDKIFLSKRAFSEQKAKKVVDPSESGTNKIRGVSMGKMPNFMNKFMPQTMNPVKNQSYIDQQLDEFQQSKDSTRRNPLFSSSESGFDKSGYYDMSVDSNAINDFEYVEKAKKFAKKT